MSTVTVRFYEELNDFLPPHLRKRQVSIECPEGCTTKALVESLGVPHTEVDLLLANGESVDFSLSPQGRRHAQRLSRIRVLDIGGLARASVPLRETRFAPDVHLGKLARLLRMLGFDTIYRE